MNIYFTAPIKRGRAHQPEFKAIVAALERYGTVHAPHITAAAISYHGETGIPDREIFERERGALDAADVIVAEVTTPGLGVGYLIGYGAEKGKKVIALYRGDSALDLSSMIKGNPAVEVYTYKTDADIETHLATALGA